MQELDKNDDKVQEKFNKIDKEFNDLMLMVPNPAFDDVPVGDSEKDNVVIREVGKKPKFKFQAKDYLKIAEKLDLIDMKRAAKVSGARFGRGAVFNRS